MKKCGFDFLAAGLTLSAMLACVTALYAQVPLNSGAHLSSPGKCAGCHVPGDQVTPENANMLTASQEVLCATCHPKAVQVSHPSGFKPVANLPESYPVDWKGDLTCSTCHEIHGAEHGLIRGELAGKDFCLACHQQHFFDEMRDGGVSTMAGHLGHELMDVALLDVYSAECLSCHETSGDVKIATSVTRDGLVRHGGSSTTHPIATLYSDSALFGGYRPVEMLSAKVLLPDGKLSCVSCHEGYSSDHGALVITSSGSQLCFECHDL